MKISVISANVNILGIVYANFVYMHYLRNATFQLHFNENNDVMAFLSECTDAPNSGSRVDKGPNTWCFLGGRHCVGSFAFTHLTSQQVYAVGNLDAML